MLALHSDTADVNQRFVTASKDKEVKVWHFGDVGIEPECKLTISTDEDDVS